MISITFMSFLHKVDYDRTTTTIIAIGFLSSSTTTATSSVGGPPDTKYRAYNHPHHRTYRLSGFYLRGRNIAYHNNSSNNTMSDTTTATGRVAPEIKYGPTADEDETIKALS
jgi:hypothetical protein